MANDPAKAERDRDIIQDRIKGMTYARLSEKYGIEESACYKIVKKHTDSTIKPAAAELVQLEIDRLERLLEALQPRIDRGEPRAIEVAIKLSESLRKLTGVDAAIKLEVEHTANAAVTALEEKLRKAAQINVEGTE
jgi:DNA-binding Lrp family transcriptional regulator